MLETSCSFFRKPAEFAAIGKFFTAVLSREGRVYTLSWGNESKLGHNIEPNDLQPYPLLGELETILVVQIAAGYCYLLALACQPSGMSVYSVGCGLRGKLGHGSRKDEKSPRQIEHFKTLNFQPVMVSAGCWHAAVLGKDGRVCTWGWDHDGCLGYNNGGSQSVPKVVEALSRIKAIHVAAGNRSTFVVSDDGSVYSFGLGKSYILKHSTANKQQNISSNVLSPEIVSSLEQVTSKVVQVITTGYGSTNEHTFFLTESGELYSFGDGNNGQLGIEHIPNQSDHRPDPEQVDVDLG